uniref:Glycine N-acyltransferase-like protein n=1 Tax=Panagrolaimus sp. PS1159 TaxID=55785 RepID=A0AC35GEH1_9BILA
MDVIIDTWKYGDKSETKIIEAYIKNMPFSMIREKATEKPISFEHSDNRGCLAHLFTLEQHRNKGLGNAVEKNICLKLIKNKIIPYKFIEISNSKVLESTIRSKYWTRWENSNGPVCHDWVKVNDKISA